ncbi:hypothetical protein F2Q69_00043486 [Brassica cretica]|uniref:Uncharacterized protein n=1 Tax=Brassica cretica TaxID=69181 RepID=A0A8S9NRG6_BRACR|nr:hypothetical protein F2Q69_00043486 [Brassica cretica]
MTNDNNTPIDTTDVTTTPLNVVATDATVTTAGNITASTAAATLSTILPAGNAADETTRRSLFGAGLYQTGFKGREKAKSHWIIKKSEGNGFKDVSEESGKDATCEERPGGREEG